jgi:hypothetical protein
MATKRPLFSNGTEFMFWSSRNCEHCHKAVQYNEGKNYMPKYRCAIQRDIEFAAIDDGCGNDRAYNAARSPRCPYFVEKGSVKRKRAKKNDTQPTLW